MGRSEELSDFQRGTVVGCHLSKKSVREISALLGLPRSTVSSVIVKWKRGGVTSALPRSGRPHKLKEEQRQVLERVALGKCPPSVEALTSEFQSACGASVSSRTVRRELHDMGFRGRVSTYKAKGVEKKTAGHEDVQEVDMSCLDLRVGRVVAALQLPHDERLSVLQVDVGEAAPRTVVSDLTQYIPEDQMQNRMAVLLCNLRPVDTRGVVSQARLVCACSPHKVELLHPPCGAAPGDRVTVPGFTGEPDEELHPERKAWEQIQTHLGTDALCVASYRGTALQVVGRGVCTSQTLSNCEIKLTFSIPQNSDVEWKNHQRNTYDC